MKKFIFAIILYFTTYICYCQMETVNWYIPNRLGLTFNTKNFEPKRLDTSSARNCGFCSSMSDRNGNLLFYTVGACAFNREHKMMPNSEINIYSKCIIVPVPYREPYIYHIFETRCVDNSTLKKEGLVYSTVSMGGDGGLGDLVNKNIVLLNPVCNKLAAIRHKNNIDIWIVVHGWNSNAFYSYLIKEYGVDSVPIISIVGPTHTGIETNRLGDMKFSRDGKKLALTTYSMSRVEIYDFDRASGIVSNPIILEDSIFYNSDDLEFSPDGKKLYIQSDNAKADGLLQLDLNHTSVDSIINSAFRLHAKGYLNPQMAIDGKIYYCAFDNNIGRINNPNGLGNECKLQDFVINLYNINENRLFRRLPKFMQSYFFDSTSVIFPDNFNYYCDSSAFDYQNFSNMNKLIINENSKQKGQIIRLTKNEPDLIGSIWYEDKVPVKKGFTTEFQFKLSQGNYKIGDEESPGADGIAFVIQNDSKFAVGKNGGGIGFENIPNSFAIEFDTYFNSDTSHNDPNANHIAVFCNGTLNNTNNHNSSANLKTITDLKTLRSDSTTYYVRIDYNVIPKKLRVFINESGAHLFPILTIDSLELDKLLSFDDGKAYVGLTSSTGSSYENHDILSFWYCPLKDSTIVSVSENINYSNKNKLINNFRLIENSIICSISLQQPSEINYSIFDILGQEIANQTLQLSSNHEVDIKVDLSNLPSGFYFFAIKADDLYEQRKFVLIK